MQLLLPLLLLQGWFAGVAWLRPAATDPSLLPLFLFTASVGAFFVSFWWAWQPQPSLSIVAAIAGDAYAARTPPGTNSNALCSSADRFLALKY